VNWQIVQRSKLYAMFVYNPWPTPIYPSYYFDELYNQFQWDESWYTKLGRQWIPFGSYRSDLIYKTFTKALGQTNEDALLINYNKNHFYTNVSVFRPHTNIKSSLLPISYNINVATINNSYDVGFSYIHSIAETQLFRYNKGFGGFMNEKIKSHVPGISNYINYNYKKTNLYLTYVSALKKFHRHDLSFNHEGAKPATFSAQAGYQFNIKNIPAKLISFYDISFQSLGLQIPKKRVGVGLNLFPVKYVDIGFQCFKDYAYPNNSVATGLNNEVKSTARIYNTIAIQVLFHI
jgi:hypothetical protein